MSSLLPTAMWTWSLGPPRDSRNQLRICTVPIDIVNMTLYNARCCDNTGDVWNGANNDQQQIEEILGVSWVSAGLLDQRQVFDPVDQNYVVNTFTVKCFSTTSHQHCQSHLPDHLSHSFHTFLSLNLWNCQSKTYVENMRLMKVAFSWIIWQKFWYSEQAF